MLPIASMRRKGNAARIAATCALVAEVAMAAPSRAATPTGRDVRTSAAGSPGPGPADEPANGHDDAADITRSAARLAPLSLEELLEVRVTSVQTASKQPEAIEDAAASVTVITAQEIKAFGANRLIEVLERTVGSEAMSTYYLRDNQITIRGQPENHYDRRVLILVDGRPVRESLAAGYDVPIFVSFPLARIARIEVVRGPGSVLYGTQAFLGTINIITHRGDAQPNEASFTFGGTSTTRAELAGGVEHGDLSVAYGFNLYDDPGATFQSSTVVPPPDGHRVRYEYPAAESGKSADLRLDWRGLTVHGVYADSAQRIVASAGHPLLPTETTSGNSFGQLSLELRRLHADAGYRIDYGKKHYGTLDVTFNHLLYRQPLGETAHDVRETGFSNDTLFEYTHYLHLGDDLRFVAGAVITHLTGKITAPAFASDGTGKAVAYDVFANPENPRPWVAVAPYSEVWLSGYGQVDYAPHRRVRAFLGGQVNKLSDFDPAVVPRAGVVVRPTDEVSAKILYGEAFRAPSFFERFFRHPLGIGNPNLRPETIQTAEAVLGYQRGDLMLDATVFQSWERDIIARRLQPSGSAGAAAPERPQIDMNVARIDSRGVELQARYATRGGIVLTSSAAYYTVENQLGHDFGLPRVLAKLGVAYTWRERVSAGIFNSLYGTGSPLGPTAAPLNAPAKASVFSTLKVSVDVTRWLGHTTGPRVSTFAYVYNLFDTPVHYPEYTLRTINAIPGRGGITAYGGVDVRF